MDVKLDKQSKIPVYLQIVDQLRAQIMCGALPSGSVLPSERGLAQMLEVHRNTVVKAYGELKSDAWIESRQGIGYVVARPPPAAGRGGRGAGAPPHPPPPPHRGKWEKARPGRAGARSPPSRPRRRTAGKGRREPPTSRAAA